MTRSIGAGSGGGGSKTVFDGTAEVSPTSTAGTLQYGVRDAVAVEYNGKAYVRFGTAPSGSATPIFYEFDPSDGSTTQLANGIKARSNYGAARVGSEIYVFGDTEDSSELQAEVYDIDADSWSEVATPFSEALYTGTRAVELNGQILVAGATSASANRAFLYDPENDSWDTSVDDSFNEITGGSAVKVPGETVDTAYVMDTAGQLFTFDGLSGWSIVDTSISPGESSAVYDGSHIWYIGGVDDSQSAVKKVVKFDPETETTTEPAQLSSGLANAPAVMLDGEIHLFGGGISTTSDTVLKYAGRSTVATGEGALYALGANDSGAELINTDTGERGGVVMGREGDGISLSKNGYVQVYKV